MLIIYSVILLLLFVYGYCIVIEYEPENDKKYIYKYFVFKVLEN